MQWFLLYFESRFSLSIRSEAIPLVIDRAQEIIQHRGQVLSHDSDGHLVFKPSWSQFFFYHPFMLVTRTEIEVKGGRLKYRLSHPIVPILTLLILMILSSQNESGLLIVTLIIVSYFAHATFLFFVHREILKKLVSRPTGEKLLALARSEYEGK